MEESRIVKTKKNAITAIAQNLLNILLSLLTRIIFVRVLSSEYLGINGLFSNILNVLSLADLGMQTAMMYSLYKPIAEEDTDKIRSLVSFFKKIYLIIALVIFVVGIAITPFLKYIINLDSKIPHLNIYFILALVNIVISYLFVYRITLVTADQKSYILNKYIIFFKIITFVAQIGLLLLLRNYFIYLLAAIIVNFISNIYQNKAALKLYPFLREKGKQPELDEKEKDKIIIDIKSLFIYKISGTIQNNTDNILISVYMGTVYVGYYSNYTIVTTAVISVITLIFASIKASVGNIIATNDTELEQKEFYYWVLEMISYWIVAFSSISCVCLFQDFIKIFFGKEYILNMEIVIAIVLNFYTNFMRQTIWIFRETTGIFHETRFITTVTAGLNIILSIIGGYFYGMFGILVATVLSRMLYAWWKEPDIMFKKIFRKSAIKYYVIYIKRFILCVITAIITYLICMLANNFDIYVSFMEKIIICILIPNVVFVFYFRKSDEYKYVYCKLVIPIINKIQKVFCKLENK